MGRKISPVPLVPKGIDQRLWCRFITNNCAQCESPKNGCTKWYAIVGQAEKCFNKWLKREVSASMRNKFRELLSKTQLETRDFLAFCKKSYRNRAEEVINKMSEEGEIYKDKNGRWRLANE